MRRMRSHSKTIIALTAQTAYVVLFVLLYHKVGAASTALVMIPAAITAWLFGARIGVLVGFLDILLNLALFGLFDHSAVRDSLARGAAFGFALLPLIGLAVGRLSDLSKRVQKELAKSAASEAKARASEANYRALVENADAAISTISEQGVFLFMNAIAAQRLGSSPESLIGKSMAELFPPKVAEAQMDIIRQVTRSGQGNVTDSETSLQGQPAWFRSSVQPLWTVLAVSEMPDVSVAVQPVNRQPASTTGTTALLMPARNVARAVVPSTTSSAAL